MNRRRPEPLAAALLGLSIAIAGGSAPGPLEQRTFRALNSGAGPAERPIWALMQLGNGLACVAVPAAMLATGHRREDALRTALAGFGGWQLAKVVKRTVRRERPNRLLDGVQLRDGDPDGRGFVSGHATVAMAIATTAGPALTPAARRLLVASSVGAGLARVHVGAHLPFDVVGGAALGALWGSVCVAGRSPRGSQDGTTDT